MPRGVARVLGWLLVGGGVALVAWFVRTMRRADTTIHVNKPASSLVQNGPFRYNRNPGYLTLTMLYAGKAILRSALWPIHFLPLVLYVIQREVIEREEYRAYKARVRRWV